MIGRITSFAALAALLSITSAHAADPAVSCESGKLKTAGKYASCVLSADSKSVKTGLPVDYTKCDATLGVKWEIAEGKGEGMCPGGQGDQADISGFLDACTDSVAAALAGDSPLPADVQECNTLLTTCGSELTTCDSNYTACSGGLTTCNASYSSCSGNLTTCNTNLTTCSGDLGTCNTNYATCSGSLATANAGTAALGDVLATKSFSSAAGLGVTGTMTNVGAQNVTPDTTAVTITQGYHNGSGSVAGDADLVAANIKIGVNLFGVVGALPAGAGLGRTGQTVCYNAAGTVITCTGTGQDGEFLRGVANSFTDNGDGTITDNVTGLMWEKESDDGTIHDKDNSQNWTNAVTAKVATLNSTSFAGHTDWRLPNIKELESLESFGVANPTIFGTFNSGCVPGCTVLTCSCTRSNVYWSSTSASTTPSNAWGVHFVDGSASGGNPKTNVVNVRAVRGGL